MTASVTESINKPAPLVWIEEKVGADWTRLLRFGVRLHPTYAKDQIKLLRKYHPGTEYRTAEIPDEDIPF